jgi:hypothetical protein
LLLAGVLLLAPVALAAQPGGEEIAGADLVVSLVTVGPGAKVFERFGHNMLWVRSARAPIDSVWDWGRFSFQTERFFIRFAQGDLRYWMKGDSAAVYLPWYMATGRTVATQELALTPAQRDRLLARLRENDTEANRYYQYHYYNDNCSTRIRDLLDTVLGGALRARTDTVVTAWSYRDQTLRLNQHNPLIYLGLTTLLAGRTDRRITAWEEMFLPEGLAHWVRELEISDSVGGTRPLLQEEQVLAEGGRFPVPAVPSRWWPGFLVVGLVVGSALAVTGRASRRRPQRAFLPLAGTYLLIAGLLGLAMALLWAASGHQVTWRNENLWQFNLAALALLPILPAARRGGTRSAPAARALVMVIAGCSLVGVLLKVLPVFGQANWDVIALALPANLGLGLGMLGRGKVGVNGER